MLVILCLLVVSATAKPKKKTKKTDGKTTIKCPLQKKLDKDGIGACPPTGCGRVDPLLNEQKNTTDGNPDSARDITFADFAAMPKLVDGYKKIGADRKPLRDAGEGNMVRVVAWALDARPQNTRSLSKRGESCNCGFTGVKDPENTDVHIVLVDDETLKLKAKATKAKPPSAKNPNGVKAKTAAFKTLKKREAQSQTAEYAPRVRVALSEDFDGAKLKTLINPTKGGRLQVRVTGLLMYDSEHALGGHALLRHTDWEIHPVFRLEFCPKGKVCSEGGDATWVDINK